MSDTNVAEQNPTEPAAGEQQQPGSLLTGTQGAPNGTEATAPAENQGENVGEKTETPAGAPEKYADFTIPENSAIRPEVLTDFQDFAKANNWSQEQAQAGVDFYVKSVLPRVQEQIANDHAAQVERWGSDTKADKEISADFNANMVAAQSAVARFATPELRELLNSTGLGNHPEMVRFCLRVGKAISEDSAIVGGVVGDTSPASLYPNSKMNP